MSKLQTVKQLKNYQYALIVFTAFVIYDFVLNIGTNGPIFDPGAYQLYCVDFSYGLFPRLLQGEIFKRLVGKYDNLHVYIFTKVFSLLMYASFALLSKKLFDFLEDETKNVFLLVIVTIIAMPFTFAFMSKYSGFNEQWSLFFFVISLLLLLNKYLKFLSPLMFVPLLLSHQGGMIYFAPTFVLVCLFIAFCTDDKKKRVSYIIIALLCCVICLPLFFVLTTASPEDAKISYEKYLKTMESRNALVFYYQYYIYGVIPDSYSIPDFPEIMTKETSSKLLSLLQPVMRQIFMTLDQINFKKGFAELLLSLPFITFFYFILKKIYEQTKTIFQKLVIIIAYIMTPLVAFIELFFSTDLIRWYSYNMINTAVLVLALLCVSGKDTIKAVFSKINFSVYTVAPYFIFGIYLSLIYSQ